MLILAVTHGYDARQQRAWVRYIATITRLICHRVSACDCRALCSHKCSHTDVNLAEINLQSEIITTHHCTPNKIF